MQGLFQTFKYRKFSCHLDKKHEKGTNASDPLTPLHDMKTEWKTAHANEKRIRFLFHSVFLSKAKQMRTVCHSEGVALACHPEGAALTVILSTVEGSDCIRPPFIEERGMEKRSC